MWIGTNDTCAAGDFEIETFQMFLDTNSEQGSVHNPFDAGFSFIVP